MSTVAYSQTKQNWLCVLVCVAVFAFMVTTGTFIHNKVLDSSERDKKTYQTAIKIQNQEQFNYSIDTHQGNILAYGEFTAADTVKYDEMNQEFISVARTTERYTRHEEEDCTTDDNGNERCTTRVYYSWDYYTSDFKQANKINLMGRQYDTSIFSLKLQKISASEIIKNVEGDYYYPEKSGWWIFETEGDIRYYYTILPKKFYGGFIADTSTGTLRGINNKSVHVEYKTINEIVKSVQKNATFSKWAFIIVWLLLTIAAMVGTVIFFNNV